MQCCIVIKCMQWLLVVPVFYRFVSWDLTNLAASPVPSNPPVVVRSAVGAARVAAAKRGKYFKMDQHLSTSPWRITPVFCLPRFGTSPSTYSCIYRALWVILMCVNRIWNENQFGSDVPVMHLATVIQIKGNYQWISVLNDDRLNIYPTYIVN